MPSIDAPIVLVTGARGGIGRALATRLHAQGWRVAATGRDAATLADVPAATHIAADTTTPEGARAAIETCRERLGDRPSRLAHCVGSTLIAPLHRTRAEQAREVLRVNLEGSIHMLAAWVESMREPAGTGAAVLISSVVSRIRVASHEAIAAAKGGVEALARSAAATYAPIGLRINAVAPGLTETPMTAPMLRVPAQREAAAKQVPLPHAGGDVQQADEVAAVIAWLLSLEAGRITGQVIPVDGGFTQIRPLVR